LGYLATFGQKPTTTDTTRTDDSMAVLDGVRKAIAEVTAISTMSAVDVKARPIESPAARSWLHCDQLCCADH
jgi:hypothetical protein